MCGIYLLLNNYARFMYRALNTRLPISSLPVPPPFPSLPSSLFLPLPPPSPPPQKPHLPTYLPPPLSLSPPSNIHPIPPAPFPYQCSYDMECMQTVFTICCCFFFFFFFFFFPGACVRACVRAWRGFGGCYSMYVRLRTMYIYMCVGMYVCMYVCMYVYIYRIQKRWLLHKRKMFLREGKVSLLRGGS